MIDSSALIEMRVYHKRYRPESYEFSHKVLYLMIKLSDLTSSIKTKLFSINRFNLFSLFWKDYGFKKFDDPAKYIYKILEKFNIKSDVVNSICLLTIPKVLGYGFNPVSFWLCFGPDKLLYAVLAEVNNTFGERHGYLCFNKDLQPISQFSTINHPKVFHVSPFCEITGNYQFQFSINEDGIKIDIDYYQDGKKLIATSMQGRKAELADKNLLQYFFAIPFMTIKVLVLIHYHALRLWIKKIPYIKKPPKLDIDIS